MEYKIIDTLIADVNVVRITTLIKTVLVRGAGIRDTAAILGVSAGKVPKTPASSNYELKPRKTRYKNLETDEFWNKQEKEQTMTGLRVSSRFRRDSRLIVTR